MSIQDLSAWEGVAKRFGSSSDDIDGAFRKTQSLVESIKNGVASGDVLTWLAKAGVNTAQLLDKATPIADKLKLIQGALSKSNAGDAQFFGQKAGYSEDTINMLRETSSNIDGLLTAQKAMNVETAEDLKNAKERSRAWMDLEDTFSRAAKDILNDLTPALEGAAKALKELFKIAGEHKTVTEVLLGTLTAISALKFVALISWFGKLTGAIGGAGVASTGLLGRLAAMGTGLAGKALGGLGMLLHSDDLNKGEEEFLAKQSRSPVKATNSSSLFAGLEKQYGLPAGLLDSVWAQESGRGKNMKSKKGALGHFQFMPGTAKQYGLRNPNDLRESSTAAAHLLSDLLKQFHGNLPQALAGYNWGAGNVTKYGLNRSPLETQNYMRQVQGRMNGGSGNSSEVNIASITVNTKATDAQTMARDMTPALKQYLNVSKANSGLS
jgi:hypothetical protein